MAQVAALTVECAINRKESRGLHFNRDYPETSSEAQDSILIPDNTVLPSVVEESADGLAQNMFLRLPEYKD